MRPSLFARAFPRVFYFLIVFSFCLLAFSFALLFSSLNFLLQFYLLSYLFPLLLSSVRAPTYSSIMFMPSQEIAFRSRWYLVLTPWKSRMLLWMNMDNYWQPVHLDIFFWIDSNIWSDAVYAHLYVYWRIFWQPIHVKGTVTYINDLPLFLLLMIRHTRSLFLAIIFIRTQSIFLFGFFRNCTCWFPWYVPILMEFHT